MVNNAVMFHAVFVCMCREIEAAAGVPALPGHHHAVPHAQHPHGAAHEKPRGSPLQENPLC